MSRTRQEWIALAEKRALSVLHTHQCCCPLRMLEAKICEAGPGDMRPNPVSLTEALRSLAAKHLIHVIPKRAPTETPFYAPASVNLDSPAFADLLVKRRHLYLLHKGLTERDEFCSVVLETIVDTALERCGHATFHSRFPSQNLPKDRPLDFVVELGGTLWGGEDKNFREWIYPDSWEVWYVISKCCEIGAVPLLITRKLAYVTFLFFGKCGMVGYQTHFQYFHPIVAPELERVKAVDGLGYKDLRFTLEPDALMIRMFGSTLPRIGPDFTNRFAARKALLLQYADREGLADRHLPPHRRRVIFSAAWKNIVGGTFSTHVT